ncbi:hypothetical protein C8R47DRAFT_570207 [Mycena vitilis]|nr:hypothetical protein C8R47DRAFT_570207 [Mycena vitilis]
MGIELESTPTHERGRLSSLRTICDLVGSFVFFLNSLWTWITNSSIAPTGDEPSLIPLLLDCEKGPIDVYQTRAQLLAALKRRDAADAAFEAQVAALLAPVRRRLAEIQAARDSRVSFPVPVPVPYAGPDVADLPPAPQIFFGRARELATLAALFTAPRQARAVLLGEPGAGTSSLALALLHHPKIAESFGARRFFVCGGDADRHVPTTVAELARLSERTLVVLDDMEALDHLLLLPLTRDPRVSFLLTMRAPDRTLPPNWTTLHIAPLPLPAARKLFRAVADLPTGGEGEDDDVEEAPLVDVSLPDTVLCTRLLLPHVDAFDADACAAPIHGHTEAALIDALLLHHARRLPRAIVQLAQRAQYEPLAFLLVRCVEEGVWV